MNVSLKLCPERDLNPHARIKWALAPQASASTIPPPGQGVYQPLGWALRYCILLEACFTNRLRVA